MNALWHGIGIHDIKVQHHIHCGRNFFLFLIYLWVLDGTAGNDFEVEEEGHFSIIFYFIFTSNKLYKY